jgi:hypothetical protein
MHDASEPPANILVFIRKRMALLWSEVARIKLSLVPSRKEGSRLGLKLDGKALPWPPANELVVAPGMHHIAIKLPDSTTRTLTIAVKAGQRRTLSVPTGSK